jgi:hypothetical protein
MFEEPKPYLVQRLLYRAEPAPESERFSVFEHFALDHMGCAEFERGIQLEALDQACLLIQKRKEIWDIRPVTVSQDITIWYLGPESRFESAAKFIGTQLIENGSDRYMAERPLKEVTCLRPAYLCQDDWARRFCAWWRLDLDHQFVLCKTLEVAQTFLAAIFSTNRKTLKQIAGR